jgi:hypothetical protein
MFGINTMHVLLCFSQSIRSNYIMLLPERVWITYIVLMDGTCTFSIVQVVSQTCFPIFTFSKYAILHEFNVWSILLERCPTDGKTYVHGFFVG